MSISHNAVQFDTPVSTPTLKWLRADADKIADFVTLRHLEAHPDDFPADSLRLKQACKDDFNHHLGFLILSASTGDPSSFTDYLLWLRQLLEARNHSLAHLSESLGYLKTYLEKHVKGGDLRSLVGLIDRGLTILKQPGHLLDIPKFVSRSPLPISEEFTSAIVKGDRQGASEIAQAQTNKGLSLVDLGVGVIQPAMYEIGWLWQTNRIGVAQEHMATAITQNIMAKAFMDSAFADPIHKKAVLACVEGNHHSLGLRVVSDSLEVNGWNCDFLGGDTPVSELIQFIDQEKPDLVALSVAMPEQLEALSRFSEYIHSTFSGSRPSVVVGGLTLNALKGVPSSIKVDAWFEDAKALIDKND